MHKNWHKKDKMNICYADDDKQSGWKLLHWIYLFVSWPHSKPSVVAQTTAGFQIWLLQGGRSKRREVM